LLDALVDAGALAASWSGAGPTLIGIVRSASADSVRAGAETALARSGVPGRVLDLRADRRGLVYGDEAIVDL
jgi:homoserine kinase